MLEIAQDRAAVAKARGGGYETLIRYATATTPPGTHKIHIIDPW